MGYQVEVIVGSLSDIPTIKESNMFDVFKTTGVSHQLSAISADRNPDVLCSHCREAAKNGTRVFIGAAGLSPALPGAIAAILGGHLPVLGVPLSSEHLPGNIMLPTIACKPPGRPVAAFGPDKAGLRNAAIFACSIVALTDEDIHSNLQRYLLEMNKSPTIGVVHS